MKYTNQTEAKKLTGLSYLGLVNNSSKHEKAYTYNAMVYTLYLAPANLSGYEVCPMRSPECTAMCLNESGRNRIDIHKNTINNSRITKTKLFFEHREFFVRWMIDEINTAKKKAEKQGFNFSVRLNNTSDITPESFYINENGKTLNVLQLFPDVQFYDYTKVSKRYELTKKYKNYDLTFSYSGHNMTECLDMLSKGVRTAMVFKKVPETYMGYKVVPGDDYDMRYKDDRNVIIGLKFKKVRKKLTTDNKFVIQ
jgi:hypothetical protein